MNRTSYIYHPVSPPVELDLVTSTAPDTSRPRPVLVFFHGGGLVSGSRRARFPPLPVKLLLDRGWAVVVPDYRLLPEAGITDILEDMRQLESWLVESAVGIDLGRIVIGGSSAGSLVSILALSVWRKVSVCSFLSLWGMSQTEGEWYCRRRDNSALLGGIPARQLQEENVAHYLQPGRPQISTDEGNIRDPCSRASLFLWMLKEGMLYICVHFIGLYTIIDLQAISVLG
jgi:pimeloyl-ACP methyl ester carboxylesterase